MSEYVQFTILDFGFEVQDSSNFKFPLHHDSSLDRITASAISLIDRRVFMLCC
jgi:hypothetical protein